MVQKSDEHRKDGVLGAAAAAAAARTSDHDAKAGHHAAYEGPRSKRGDLHGPQGAAGIPRRRGLKYIMACPPP